MSLTLTMLLIFQIYKTKYVDLSSFWHRHWNIGSIYLSHVFTLSHIHTESLNGIKHFKLLVARFNEKTCGWLPLLLTKFWITFSDGNAASIADFWPSLKITLSEGDAISLGFWQARRLRSYSSIETLTESPSRGGSGRGSATDGRSAVQEQPILVDEDEDYGEEEDDVVYCVWSSKGRAAPPI